MITRLTNRPDAAPAPPTPAVEIADAWQTSVALLDRLRDLAQRYPQVRQLSMAIPEIERGEMRLERAVRDVAAPAPPSDPAAG